MVSILSEKKEIIEEQLSSLPQDEIKWSTVTLSNIISGKKRLEASYFDIDGKNARDKILKNIWGYINLNDDKVGLIKSSYYPGRFKRIYSDSQNGIPFYLPSQMTDIYPRPEKYISRLTNCNFEDLKLKRGMLLLTRSGTVGNVALVSKTLENLVFSDDVIRITLKEPHDIGFVYTFLKTNVGNKILQTNGYGSVITHIEPEHLSEIIIPNPPIKIKEKINELIMSSHNLRDESNDLTDKAEQLLYKELNLPSICEMGADEFLEEKGVNNFGVSLSNIRGRLDGSYHVPIVNSILEHFKSNAKEIISLGDQRISKKIILPGRFKRIYVDERQGRVFFGGKQIFELDPLNKKYLSIAKHSTRIKSELEINENTILITRSGTIGKTAITPKHWQNWIANEHIIRVVPVNNEIAGYISIFLATDYGYQLITRNTYGSVIDEIDDRQVSQIPIPLLKNKVIQNEINELALQANQKRYDAYKLEQKAMRIMNEEVIYTEGKLISLKNQHRNIAGKRANKIAETESEYD